MQKGDNPSEVELITLQGGHFALRVSASLLNAIGLPEMIVRNLDAYEHLAVRLASHPAEHQKIKAKLSVNRLTEPLFDTHGFVGHLEAAYQKMWCLLQADQAAQQFEVIGN